MTAQEASAYLFQRFRIRRSVATLRNLRITDKGPVYIKQGTHRGAAIVYMRPDLDTWAMRMIYRRVSTSEMA
jgi:hypothetical protein